MSPIHICNTFFEQELESNSSRELLFWMRCHPVVLQLQFLPLLYAQPEELIGVSDLPENPDPRLVQIDQVLPGQVQTLSNWGSSLSILKWAKATGISYSAPDWGVVRTVNSKIFSYLESPRLPGSALIENQKDAEQWIAKTPGHKVLKTAFGAAGKGHFHVGISSNLDGFLQRQFAQGLPVLGEPWVERLFDFSTQWKNGSLLGATVFETDAKGVYEATLAGPSEKIFGPFFWALEEHLAIARPIIKKMTDMGFFGHFGIDAYVYKSDRIRLQPIVEINARKTMSWAALQVQQQKYPDAPIRFSFSRRDQGLLPSELTVQGKRFLFRRNISYEIMR